jgi:protein-arginine kinase activator protein McsA
MKNRRNRNFMSDFDSIMNNFFGFTPQSFFGDIKNEEGVDEKGKWVKQTFTSEDGSVSMTSFYRESDGGTPRKTDKVEKLKYKLQECIENDNFEEAIILRDQIKNFENNKEKIVELKTKLSEAIKSQDFEAAIKLRDELKNLEN